MKIEEIYPGLSREALMTVSVPLTVSVPPG